MPTRRHVIALAAVSAVVPGLIRWARASPWPDRTVHMVVPLAAGGPTDVNARVVAEPLFGTSSLASNGALYRSLDYSPFTDLSPVSLVARFPFFMFVPNSSPAKTVPEFVDYVKAQPGKLIIASPGTGSGPHLANCCFCKWPPFK